MIYIIVGNKAQTLIDISNRNDYFSFLNNKFPFLRWYFAVFIIGNATVFNKLLYKGAFPKNNVSKSIYAFYKNSFNKIFNQGLAQTNFFLNILINGKIKYLSALPIDCTEILFKQAKNNINTTKFTYTAGDLLEIAPHYKEYFHCVVLSDIPSYLQNYKGQMFMQLLHPSICTGGIIIIRFYLYIPQNIDYTGFLDITAKYKKDIAMEKVGMYIIKIFQKI